MNEASESDVADLRARVARLERRVEELERWKRAEDDTRETPIPQPDRERQ